MSGIIAKCLDAASERLDQSEGEGEKDDFLQSAVFDLRSGQKTLAGYSDTVTGFIKFCNGSFESQALEDENVYWLECRRGFANKSNTRNVVGNGAGASRNAAGASRNGAGPSGGDYVHFNITPVNVAPYLYEALFKKMKTVICTSATLTTANSFDFWGERTGVSLLKASKQKKRVLEGIFPSPFPYKKNVLLAVPTDAPAPTEPGFRDFLNDAVKRLVLASGGGALVLFTSFDSLNQCCEYCRGDFEAEHITTLKQGADERSRLLKNFIADTHSVLFATDSFWEGVDAPGATLRLLLICRLPFRIPNEPVFEARCEALERAGSNPFMELSVPEAVIKFRQGFGRLIRSSTDRGVVAVLDNRLLTKRYGKIFLDSLPQTQTCFEPLSHCVGAPAERGFILSVL
jgi:Rad3-related DNA helicase